MHQRTDGAVGQEGDDVVERWAGYGGGVTAGVLGFGARSWMSRRTVLAVSGVGIGQRGRDRFELSITCCSVPSPALPPIVLAAQYIIYPIVVPSGVKPPCIFLMVTPCHGVKCKQRVSMLTTINMPIS